MQEAIEHMKETSVTEVLTDLNSRSSEYEKQDRERASQQINTVANNQVEQQQMGMPPSPVSTGDVAQQMQSMTQNQNMSPGMMQGMPQQEPEQPIEIDENEIL
jgi:hypothetical protein